MRRLSALILFGLLACVLTVPAHAGGLFAGDASSSGAPADVGYWTDAASSTLTAERNLGALTTGLVLNTVTAGVGVPSTYGGASCTNQLIRSLSGAGAATCSSVSLTADVTGILPTANGGTGIAYFTAAGPSVARVYTFPDSAATMLYSGGALGTPSSGTLTNVTGLPAASVLAGTLGTGAYVMDTTLTLPTLIGGTGTTSTLVLQSTSGVGTTGADIIFKVGNNGATEAGRFDNAGKLTLLHGLTMSGQQLTTGSISLSGSSDEINFGGMTLTGVSGNLRGSAGLFLGASSGSPASLLDLRAGDLTMSGANGQKYVLGRATELVAVGSGISTKATTIQIPADAIVYAVPVRVKTQPGGTTTVTVTATTSGTAFQKGASISTVAGTTDPGTKNTPVNYNSVAAQTVTLTFDAPTTDALGEVRIDLYYSTSTPPTS